MEATFSSVAYQHEGQSESQNPSQSVLLYVDPSCPFAWITSRWLVEAATYRPVQLELRVMSLSVLNEGRQLEDWYREFNDRAWGPARVAVAVQQRHGGDALAAFYTGYGTRRHTQGDRDDARMVPAALADAGLPVELAAMAGSTELDAELRGTHAHVQSLVGEELGTPVIVLDGAAFFGPVCTGIPRGESAARLLDLVQLAAGCPSFTELKRGRRDELSFV